MISKINFFTSVMLIRLLNFGCGASEGGREGVWSGGIHDFTMTVRTSGGGGPGGVMGPQLGDKPPSPPLGAKRKEGRLAANVEGIHDFSLDNRLRLAAATSAPDAQDFLRLGTETGLSDKAFESVHDFSLLAHPMLGARMSANVGGGVQDYSNLGTELLSLESSTMNGSLEREATETLPDFNLARSPEKMETKQYLNPLDVQPVMGVPNMIKPTSMDEFSSNERPNLSGLEAAKEGVGETQGLNVLRSSKVAVTSNNSSMDRFGALVVTEASTAWMRGIYDFMMNVKPYPPVIVTTMRDFFVGDARFGESEESPTVGSGIQGCFLDARPSFGSIEVATVRDGGERDLSMSCPSLGAPKDVGTLRIGAQEACHQSGASEAPTAGGRSIHDFSIMGARPEPTEVATASEQGMQDLPLDVCPQLGSTTIGGGGVYDFSKLIPLSKPSAPIATVEIMKDFPILTRPSLGSFPWVVTVGTIHDFSLAARPLVAQGKNIFKGRKGDGQGGVAVEFELEPLLGVETADGGGPPPDKALDSGWPSPPPTSPRPYFLVRPPPLWSLTPSSSGRTPVFNKSWSEENEVLVVGGGLEGLHPSTTTQHSTTEGMGGEPVSVPSTLVDAYQVWVPRTAEPEIPEWLPEEELKSKADEINETFDFATKPQAVTLSPLITGALPTQEAMASSEPDLEILLNQFTSDSAHSRTTSEKPWWQSTNTERPKAEPKKGAVEKTSRSPDWLFAPLMEKFFPLDKKFPSLFGPTSRRLWRPRNLVSKSKGKSPPTPTTSFTTEQFTFII